MKESFYSLNLDDAVDTGHAIRPKKQEEVSLWRSVIVRAIKDALGVDQDDQRKIKENQSDALKWFYEGGADFKRVCEYAELEPEFVQFAVLDFLTDPEQGVRAFRQITRRQSSSNKLTAKRKKRRD